MKRRNVLHPALQELNQWYYQLHVPPKVLPFVSPAFQEVSIDIDGNISTKDASLFFVVEMWIIHILTKSEVWEQRDCKLDK